MKKGHPQRTYKNGEKNGTWGDLNHPADDSVDGFALKAKHMVAEYLRAFGLIKFGVPKFDLCTWTPEYVELGSKLGSVTTLRRIRGIEPLDDSQDHYTDVVGFQINGVPAQRAEIQSNGKVRIYPITGTFDGDDVLTFANGGGTGALLVQADSENDLHLNYPVIANSDGIIEGIDFESDVNGDNFTNTL